MNIDFTEGELDNLIQVLDKEISVLEKEIHRTDALVYKHELLDKVRALGELRNKLQQVVS